MRAIILAAGRGSRMKSAEGDTPKSLYRVAGETALERQVDQILGAGIEDITVVLGYKAGLISSVLDQRYGTRVSTVENERYDTDTNIRSLICGVGDRLEPFVVFEADCVFRPESMQRIFAKDVIEKSAWFTIGKFQPHQVGAILDTDNEGVVRDVKYLRGYDAAYASYRKLIGVFKVGPEHVAPYMALVLKAADQSVAQYYFQPWIDELDKMKSFEVSIEQPGVGSFNTVDELAALRNFHDNRSADSGPNSATD